MGGRAAVVQAAGVVVHDEAGRFVVVHRPRYDDWSLPKGKLEADEPHPVAAVRECWEETGLRVRLEAPLPDVTYRAARTPKVVRYWRAAITSDEGFVPGAEVDELRWVAPDEAARVLTHVADRRIAARSAALGPTRALVLLRHAAALARRDWAQTPGRPSTGDAERPLTPHGHDQAVALAPLLACYGIERIVTSPSLRCRQSVDPLAALTAVPAELDHRFSEEGSAADPDATRTAAAALVVRRLGTVLCTHRPVLPLLADALLPPARHLDPPLEPSGCVLLHLDHGGNLMGLERHDPSPD